MEHEQAITRYRRWYGRLLHLYPTPYRERFAESMTQTFNDLCRERAAAGQRLLPFVIWMFLETSAGIIRDNVRFHIMRSKNLFRIAIGTGLILLIPLIAMQVSDNWNWGFFDFVFAFALIFGTGVTFDLVARKGGTLAYSAAVGITCLAAFLLLWINAAVGIIGDEEVANVMYLAVLAVGLAGAFMARFEARGMSRTLALMAIVQAVIPLIAMTWVPEERFKPGYLPVMGLNAVWVAAWLVAALLFRFAAKPQSKIGKDIGHGASQAGSAA